VSVTDRDKKILMLLVPVALIAAYWFLLFAPKREESAAIQEKLSQAETELQTAESQAASVSGAKQNFASDYTTVIRLGKAVPSNVDMPSLLMQLDRAARGTGIDFDKIATGERSGAAAGAPTPPGGGSGTNAQGGNAQSPAGKAQQTAQNDVNQANGQNANNQAAQGGGTTPGAGGSGAGAPGLESIPLDFTFEGNYFDLADFFHRMKRFVRVANDDNIVVRGRLMTIDSFNWKADAQNWPQLTAEVHATVYLAPKAQGVNAGATPQGPGAAPVTPASGGAAPAAPSSPATTAPAATVK
jgi:Tfp pilus assembly protein PilO